MIALELGTSYVERTKMASRLRSRLKLLSPYVDEKVFRNLQKRLEVIPQPERTAKKVQPAAGWFCRRFLYCPMVAFQLIFNVMHLHCINVKPQTKRAYALPQGGEFNY